MSEFVSVTIAGQRFSLTKEEASFMAEHLKTAVVNPNASLNFVRRGNGSGGGAVQHRAPRPDGAGLQRG